MSRICRCRICQQADMIEPLHSFGPQPVAGYLDETANAARAAPRFPLQIMICTRCGLVQQSNDEAQALLLSKVYAQYQPTYSMSATVRDYIEKFIDHSLAMAAARPGDLTVEIGSNDGGMLSLLNARKMRALGVEPSKDLCSATRARGLLVENGYFGGSFSDNLAKIHGSAKLILTRHTLEHAFDPLDFLRGISGLLAADGLAVIEVPYVGLQMQNNQFQSLTFQHITHFSLISLSSALRAAGLTLIDARFVNMDGGSVVAFASKGKGAPARFIADGVTLERAVYMDQPRGHSDYFASVGHIIETTRSHVVKISKSGASVGAYGAGSKGQALLNMLSLDVPLIDFVIDDTPGYAGRFIPGTGIPVIAGTDPIAENCDTVLVTAPTHVHEIVAKERQRLGRHARFLATTPSLHYVTEELIP